MYKLDQLTNQHYTPKPISITGAHGRAKDVKSIEMEEATPGLTVGAINDAKAPEEIARASKLKHDRLKSK